MKSQLMPLRLSREHEALARDSLQLNFNSKAGNRMFAILYEFILYAIMPIAFEMSYVKIFQRTMSAYHINDVDAMGRLIIYFAIQWFLGVLVRKKYLRASLKRITLALLILMQIKEIIYEDVLLDMFLSVATESGLMVLLFFKFAHLVVILKMAGMCWILLGTLLALIASRFHIQRLGKVFVFASKNINTFMNRIHQWFNYWNKSYC